jgi:hypothetical protein
MIEPTSGPASDGVQSLIGHEVVLDTAGPVLFLGRLVSVGPEGFWLDEADVHHSDDGHATREEYISESVRYGIRANRQRVFVFRTSVISMSALRDIVQA